MSTLLAGDVAWWTDDAVAEAFGTDERVTVIGEAEGLTAGNARVLGAVNSERVAEALRLGYDQVVFLSWELTFYRGSAAEGMPQRPDELAALSSVLSRVAHQAGVRVLYVATDDIDLVRESDERVRREALEALCWWYLDQGLDVKVLRVPHLTSVARKDDCWRRAFVAAHDGAAWEMGVPASQPLDFVDVRDLARLVGAVLADWEQPGPLRLHAAGDHSFADIAERIRSLVPGAQVSFADSPVDPLGDPAEEHAVESALGFACEYDVLRGIDELWAAVSVPAEHGATGAKAVLERVFRPDNRAVMVVELVLGAVFVEWLNAMLGTSVQFSAIDFRLLYVVIFAATYGTGAGLGAAGAMIVALAAAYLREGVALSTLFLNASMWPAFFLYFIVGSSVGYLHRKAVEDLRFADRRADVLEDQLTFVRGLYDEACVARNEYRHDLLESRDGFGRIFDVVKRLSLEDTSRIFTASIGVLEDVLDTRRAAIYAISDRAAGYARLVVSSEELDGKLSKSVRLEDYAAALKVLEAGEVWFNADLVAGLPSYIAGVKSAGRLRVLIMLYDVRFDQASSYYSNLLHILAGLMENFLIHAWNDEQSREAERYVSGTGILERDAFLHELDAMHEMRREHVGDYRILAVDAEGRTLAEVDAAIGAQMRMTDTAGLGADGRVYVLLRQVDDATLPIVEARFARAGIKVEPLADEAVL